jgi:hypothetical protein
MPKQAGYSQGLLSNHRTCGWGSGWGSRHWVLLYNGDFAITLLFTITGRVLVSRYAYSQ